jgi:CBS domain-containing protein
MKKVSDILERKGRNIISISPLDTVYDALKLMAQNNIGSVVVLHNGSYAGILTERDYSRKVILNGKHSTQTKVAEIMTSDLPGVSPSDSIEHCMQLMSGKNIRYLPVFEEGKIAGIISIHDVINELLASQQETISQLKDYLHSGL